MKFSSTLFLKKALAAVLSLCMFTGISAAANDELLKFTESQIKVLIDNEWIALKDHMPMTREDGSEWLPLKDICDDLGYDLRVDETSGTVTVTRGENCKNSEGACDKVIFEIGAEEVVMYSGEYENRIRNAYTNIETVYEPMSYVIDGAVYMPAYYLCRALNLKLAGYTGTESKEIKLYTQNYINALTSESKPAILVTKSFDIIVNKTSVDFRAKPFLDKNGRTLVPVREFAESIGKTVHWFGDTNTVCVSNGSNSFSEENCGGFGGDSIWFTVGENRYRINGTYYDMDTEAQMVGDQVFVPLRILAEYMGYRVLYHPPHFE